MKKILSFLVAMSPVGAWAVCCLPPNPAPPPSSLGFQLGMNYSALEFGDPRTAVPTNSLTVMEQYLTYWAGKHVMTIRLPIKWERLQPTLGGALDTTYLGYITAGIQFAAQNGMTVLIDLHNYCRYTQSGGTVVVFGTSPLASPYTNYADVWTKLANTFKSYTNIYGYDLMNEPHDVPSGIWPAAAQAAINAIRAVDTKTPIFVEGEDFSAASGWATANPTLNTLTDSSNNLVFSAHNYATVDSQSFQTFTSSSDTFQSLVQNYNSGTGNFSSWCKSNGFRCHIGESGVSAGNNATDGQDLLQMMDNFIAQLKLDGVPFHYWEGGSDRLPFNSVNTTAAPTSFGPPAVDAANWAGEGTAPGLKTFVPGN